ncbi:hypothetical protein GCM10023237_26300 [Streptomyces coeruleoprunus]
MMSADSPPRSTAVLSPLCRRCTVALQVVRQGNLSLMLLHCPVDPPVLVNARREWLVPWSARPEGWADRVNQRCTGRPAFSRAAATGSISLVQWAQRLAMAGTAE